MTILALVGSVACAPAPSTADDVALSDEAPKEAPDEDAPTEDAPTEEPKGPTDEEPPTEEPAPEPAEPPAPEKPAPAPELPPGVTTGEVKFINGEVPKVESFLDKMRQPVAQCVADHGGMAKDRGTLAIQFLVRLQGKAEGVEVLERGSISEEAARCIRQAFKAKWVGTPTADPTGVQFSYELERRTE